MRVQVTPLRIDFLDQSNFPESLPLLYPFLSRDCFTDVTVFLIIYKTVYFILLGEPGYKTLTMLTGSAY